MIIPETKISELKKLYQNEYGIELCDADTHEFGSWMIGVLQAVYEPNYKQNKKHSDSAVTATNTE